MKALLRTTKIISRIAIASFLFSCLSNFADASEFDDCVLQHAQGTTSDAATQAVKESCIRQTERLIPLESAVAMFQRAKVAFGKLPILEGGNGLYVTVNNNSSFTLSEVMFRIEDKKSHSSEDYVIRSFMRPPPQGAISFVPSDIAATELLPPGLHSFYFKINQSKPGSWIVSQAKGFRD